MKLLTYNIMEGGVKPEPSRLEKVLRVMAEQDAEVIGLQETLTVRGKDNQLIGAIRDAGVYKHDVVFDGEHDWAQTTGVALFSKEAPYSARVVGSHVKAVEMTFPITPSTQTITQDTQKALSLCNVYLSHVSEAVRRPQIEEVLQELRGQHYSVLFGDFNALSPQDAIPQSAVESFSDRMKEKYCRDGKLCYDTVEAVLNAGYVDVGLRFHKPEEITGKTDLGGPKTGGGHTRGIRMDFIFATEAVLPSVEEFVLVNEGLARTASDHFPWYVGLDDTLFKPTPKEE